MRRRHEAHEKNDSCWTTHQCGGLADHPRSARVDPLPRYGASLGGSEEGVGVNVRAYCTAGRVGQPPRASGACIMQYCTTVRSSASLIRLRSSCWLAGCMLSDLRISGSAGQACAVMR